ncbi:MAG: hypothetical protein EU521_00895 [Promethearchaeota archaeon]|nr:MAG: hypothetical protein EU521_00895 [Candidatus Lokiarchaeota archaeon]
MELDSLPTSFYLYYKSLFKGVDIQNIEADLRKLRMVKDNTELEIFRQAGKVAQKTQEINLFILVSRLIKIPPINKSVLV